MSLGRSCYLNLNEGVGRISLILTQPTPKIANTVISWIHFHWKIFQSQPKTIAFLGGPSPKKNRFNPAGSSCWSEEAGTTSRGHQEKNICRLRRCKLCKPASKWPRLTSDLSRNLEHSLMGYTWIYTLHVRNNEFDPLKIPEDKKFGNLVYFQRLLLEVLGSVKFFD